MPSWKAAMPSNIALIKYMGKKDADKNIPSNSSLSWTLNHLVTNVELKTIEGKEDKWSPLASDFPFEMSEKGRTKFLNHLQRIKDHFGVKEAFEISSANNFPADCGIASSASSFAALTEVACLAFSELTGKEISQQDKAMLSARGSGSSCRSFFNEWVKWSEQGLEVVESRYQNIQHMVVIVGAGTKKVSSSQAHLIIQTSSLNHGRCERAEARLQVFIEKMQAGVWQEMFEQSWQEFWDMHALFETSKPPFGYYLPGSMSILTHARDYWSENGDGPLVTMDAGPNVHLLWREDQKTEAQRFFETYVKNQWTCLTNIEGIGFAQV